MAPQVWIKENKIRVDKSIVKAGESFLVIGEVELTEYVTEPHELVVDLYIDDKYTSTLKKKVNYTGYATYAFKVTPYKTGTIRNRTVARIHKPGTPLPDFGVESNEVIVQVIGTPVQKAKLIVYVYDKYTRERLAGAKVTLDGKVEVTGKDGSASFEVDVGKTYTVKVEKTGYEPATARVTIRDVGVSTISIGLEPKWFQATVVALDKETNKPVRGARVYVSGTKARDPATGKEYAVTNGNGYAVLLVYPAKKKVTLYVDATDKGYKLYQKEITPMPGEKQFIKSLLEKAPTPPPAPAPSTPTPPSQPQQPWWEKLKPVALIVGLTSATIGTAYTIYRILRKK